MNPLPPLNDFLNTPDFWMLLLCDEFMGEDRFREFLESMKNEETSNMLEKGKGDYHVRLSTSTTIYQ